MKAAHVSLAALIPLIGGLLVAVGNLMQGHGDWNAVMLAITGIVVVFLPAGQLAFARFTSAPVQGEMPVLKPSVPERG